MIEEILPDNLNHEQEIKQQHQPSTSTLDSFKTPKMKTRQTTITHQFGSSNFTKINR